MTLNRQGDGGGAVALAVERVAKTLQELREKGVEAEFGPSEYRPCFIAGIRDPFGNTIFLQGRDRGVAQERTGQS